MIETPPIAPLGAERYTPLARIGVGGQAEILLARHHGDSGFERLVVIKRLLPHLLHDPDSVRRLKSEAQLVARLRHPNVCQVLNLIDGKHGPILVLEYLEGVTLSMVSKSLAPVRSQQDVRFIVGALQQSCEGLHCAHEFRAADGTPSNLVHRDISANNLLVTREGIAKVLDFGIAVENGSDVQSVSIRGTAAFMSPEQIRNEQLDRRSDLFSLTVVAYEALTGKGLFRREYQAATFNAVLEFEPPPMSERQPQVNKALENAIFRNLKKAKEERFSNAREFGDALAEAMLEVGGPMRLSEMSDYVNSKFGDLLRERAKETAGFAGDEGDEGDDTSMAFAETQYALPNVDEEERTETASVLVQGADELFDDYTMAALPVMTRTTIAALPDNEFDSIVDSEILSDPLRFDPPTTAPAAPMPLPVDRAATQAVDTKARRGPGLLLLGLIFGGVLGAVFFAMLSRGTAEKSAKGQAADAASIGASVTAPADASMADAAPAASSTADAAPLATLADAAPTPDAAPERARPPKKQVRSNADRQKPGFFTVDSRPPSTIYIDGKRVGKVPVFRHKLRPGKHRVKAVRSDGQKKSFSISLRSGQDLRRRVRW